MLSSSVLWQSISDDLDQNAYTTRHWAPKVLRAINSACNFVRAYYRRPRTLVWWNLESATAVKEFTFDHNLFYPYRAYLDEEAKDITNIPIIDFINKENGKIYIQWNVVKTTEAGKKLTILYHAWHKKIEFIWVNDINMPDEMEQCLLHIALWFIYPWGMDLWASLANQNYQMAKTLLDTYSDAYWKQIQPKAIQPSPFYSK